MRWRIDVEYDGRDFVGWQVQPDKRTVQGVLEAAVGRLFGSPARVCPSGRTDAGVHAEQQVATFVHDVERSPKAVRDGLNAFLPPDVAVLSAVPVADSFDPRRQVKTKIYRYQWLDRPSRSPLIGNRVWHVRTRLDADALHAGAQHLVGTHDFTSFRAQGCQADHAVRTVPMWHAERNGDLVTLRVQGHGFLRHMIRIVAGTLYEVARGARDPDWIRGVLEAQSRSSAGKTAPANGLTLESVRYD